MKVAQMYLVLLFYFLKKIQSPPKDSSAIVKREIFNQ